MMLEEIVETEEEKVEKETPSFNHSYICTEIISQLLQNAEFKPLVELTLDIDKGLTPDISVFPKASVQPNFLRDIPKFPEMPILAIEVISASQNIQDLLEKAQLMINNGVKAVWTVEPFGNTIFVTTEEGEQRFHNQEVESEGIKVDFRRIFSTD
jgi:Uma2 family endonuclease